MEQIKKPFDKENNAVAEEPQFEIKRPQLVEGTVTGCLTLNMRAKPGLDAPVVKVLKALDRVKVDDSRSTEDFFRVCFNGEWGYCMKTFVSLKQ